jgi:hypothetical protein
MLTDKELEQKITTHIREFGPTATSRLAHHVESDAASVLIACKRMVARGDLETTTAGGIPEQKWPRRWMLPERLRHPLKTAADVFRRHVTGDHVCPECGSGDASHEDNGCAPTSIGYTLRCIVCNMQWSPNEG